MRFSSSIARYVSAVVIGACTLVNEVKAFGIADESSDEITPFEEDADPAAESDEVCQAAVMNEVFALTCACSTRCSSNPEKGWTKSYPLGDTNNFLKCYWKAKAFCKLLASDYVFIDPECKWH